MSFPRYVDADLNTFFTRGTQDQRFFFAPSPEVEQIFGYLLAATAARYGLGVHAATVMADHVHIELTDRRGALPAAIQWFGSLTARAINALRRHDGPVYSRESIPNYVYPRCELSVLDRITYTMTNPVHHGAVRHADAYPGFCVRPEWYLNPPTFERPAFFRGGGTLPSELTLHLEIPDEYAHLSVPEFVSLLRREVQAKEDSIAAERAMERLGYMGPSQCRRLDWQRTAAPHAPSDSRVKEAIARQKSRAKLFRRMLRRFRRAYHETRQRWCAGERQIEWPHGTWKMCRLDGFPMVGPDVPPPPPPPDRPHYQGV